MLELKPRVIGVKLGETVYQVRVPNAREIKEMQAVKDQDIDVSIDLLDKLGLPKAVAWELDVESLQLVFEALIPAKKS